MAKQKTKTKKKPNNDAWFIKVRGSYLPSSVAGWLTYIPFTAYLIFALVVGLEETGSLALAVLFIVPNWIAAAVVMTEIAARKS